MNLLFPKCPFYYNYIDFYQISICFVNILLRNLITYYWNNRNISSCLVNPYHVNKAKELEDNSPTKNDKKDAKIIIKSNAK